MDAQFAIKYSQDLILSNFTCWSILVKSLTHAANVISDVIIVAILSITWLDIIEIHFWLDSESIFWFLLVLQMIPIKIATGQFRCPVCSKDFISRAMTARHILTHTGQKPFACTECTYACNQKPHLISHYKRIHKIVFW